MKKPLSVFYTASARKDLQKINRSDAGKIVRGIKKRTSEADPLRSAKALSGVFQRLFRYRIGDYRAVFEYRDSETLVVLTILRIKHRKDIYRS